MATRALTTSGIALTSAVAANDTAPADWTAHPLARRLLASFAATPPPVATLDRHQRWDSRDTVYAGFRVACLRAIRTSVVDTAFLAAEAARDAAAVAWGSGMAAWQRAEITGRQLGALRARMTRADAKLSAITFAVTVDEAIDAAIRIPTLPTFTTAARQLDPAVWGAAL